MSSPYSEMAVAAFNAGWAPLPLPLRAKKEPPKGWTGRGAPMPSRADVQTWLDDYPMGNLALRLPEHVVGIDVDAYGAKPGAQVLAELEQRLGPLPATWRSSSRLDVDDVSGVRLFRVDRSTAAWRDLASGGIEVLRHEWRYMCAPPSLHPEGRRYEWLDERTGERTIEPPAVDSLPLLPDAWQAHLDEGAARSSGVRFEDQVAYGTRDQQLFRLACRLRHDDYEIEHARSVVQAQWQRMEQPPGEHYPLQVALEKVDRVYQEYPAGSAKQHATAALQALVAPSEAEASRFIDWAQAFTHDPDDIEWLVPGVVEAGRGYLLYSAAKAGKSLLALDWCLALATGRDPLTGQAREPVDVLYVDYENAQTDIVGRLRDLGVRDPSALQRLHYWSFPAIRKLDDAIGGAELVHAALDVGAQLVVVDTAARTIGGREDEADTWNAWYGFTGAPLKRHRIAWVRLDHTGKDAGRGARGSSSKVSDVDAVWQLAADGDRLDLVLHERRQAHYRERIVLRRGDIDGVLRHRPVAAHDADAASVAHVIRLLDDLDAPFDLARRPAAELLARHGYKVLKRHVEAAVKQRKSGPREPGPLPLDDPAEQWPATTLGHCGPTGSDPLQDKGKAWPATTLGHSGPLGHGDTGPDGPRDRPPKGRATGHAGRRDQDEEAAALVADELDATEVAS